VCGGSLGETWGFYAMGCFCVGFLVGIFMPRKFRWFPFGGFTRCGQIPTVLVLVLPLRGRSRGVECVVV
jgi:hypothetical protein